jgi:hypothetical protein
MKRSSASPLPQLAPPLKRILLRFGLSTFLAGVAAGFAVGQEKEGVASEPTEGRVLLDTKKNLCCCAMCFDSDQPESLDARRSS